MEAERNGETVALRSNPTRLLPMMSMSCPDLMPMKECKLFMESVLPVLKNTQMQIDFGLLDASVILMSLRIVVRPQGSGIIAWYSFYIGSNNESSRINPKPLETQCLSECLYNYDRLHQQGLAAV